MVVLFCKECKMRGTCDKNGQVACSGSCVMNGCGRTLQGLMSFDEIPKTWCSICGEVCTPLPDGFKLEKACYLTFWCLVYFSDKSKPFLYSKCYSLMLQFLVWLAAPFVLFGWCFKDFITASWECMGCKNANKVVAILLAPLFVVVVVGPAMLVALHQMLLTWIVYSYQFFWSLCCCEHD